MMMTIDRHGLIDVSRPHNIARPRAKYRSRISDASRAFDARRLPVNLQDREGGLMHMNLPSQPSSKMKKTRQ
jgi:hypothetical protein